MTNAVESKKLSRHWSLSARISVGKLKTLLLMIVYVFFRLCPLEKRSNDSCQYIQSDLPFCDNYQQDFSDLCKGPVCKKRLSMTPKRVQLIGVEYLRFCNSYGLACRQHIGPTGRQGEIKANLLGEFHSQRYQSIKPAVNERQSTMRHVVRSLKFRLRRHFMHESTCLRCRPSTRTSA